MEFFHRVKEAIQIYLLYVKKDIDSQLSFKFDFFMQIVIWFVYSLIPFIGVTILFSKFHRLGNYNLYHIGLFYSVVGLSYDVSRMIGRTFDNFHNMVITGDLDIFYIRPQSLLLQLFGYNFFIRRFAGILQYIIILIYSVSNIYESINFEMPTVIFVIFVSFFSTTLIFIGLLLVYASICIFTVQKNIFSDVIVDSVNKIGIYPIQHLPKILQKILIYIIPIGLTVYMPLNQLLFWNETHPLNYFCFVMPLIVGLLFFVVTRKIFQISLNFYKSMNN